jgi:hypothetical protein
VGDWGLLGEVLASEGSDRNRANVTDLVAHAKDLLKLVRETFPAYTMHDEQHAENVIRLMGRLAAPRIEVMTSLEAALLILAAYFHDAGMAYSPAEIARVPHEAGFEAFLREHDEAYLATLANGDVPPEAVIRQYCRHRHADRVRVHLERCDRALLRWDGVSMIEPLVTICRSHNEPAAALHEPRFRTDHLYRADLRFCATMLRLADILDLDDTRAPLVIYDHLALPGHTNPEAATSDREWKKHLAARGFAFPPHPSANYALQFAAEPTSPGVEHDLRVFLGVITVELQRCRGVMDVCGDRWRGLPLPGAIDTSAITGHGYKYGEFRFELDRSAVLDLFAGEQLYDHPYAFLRELLQNALDAIRTRGHLFGHESTGVAVTCWEDDAGYLWVRVDDDGIGMDERSLREYFLRIGRSYYRSAEFEAELARRGMADRPFGVISRFGVGILSCFMVGDRVEISSRHAAGGRAVRLSVSRRDDFFVLQEEGMNAGDEMPGRHGCDQPFPAGPGTRIAVRVDPNHTGITATEVIAETESCLFAPPVPVFANGTEVTARISAVVRPAAPPPIQVLEVDASELQSSPSDARYRGAIRIVAVPLDLHRVTECPNVDGQILAHFVLPPRDGSARDLLAGWTERPAKIGRMLKTAVVSFEAELRHSSRQPDQARIEISRKLDRETIHHTHRLMLNSNWRDQVPRSADWSAQSHLISLNHARMTSVPDLIHHRSAYPKQPVNSELLIPVARLPADPHNHEQALGQNRFGYNGVALPASNRPGHNAFDLPSRSGFVHGLISLSGDLRPDLTVSRTKIRGLSFPIHSAVHLAVRRAAQARIEAEPELAAHLTKLADSSLLGSLPPTEPETAALFWSDKLLRDGAWCQERVIDTDRGRVSVADLRSAGDPPSFDIDLYVDGDARPKFLFYSSLQQALLHFFVSLVWVPDPRSPRNSRLRMKSARRPQHHPGAFHFAPLFSVEYSAPYEVARAGRFLNANHAFSRWLVENASELSKHFAAPFERILRPLRSVETINTAMDGIARSRPDLAPPEDAYLRLGDDGWWWTR